MTTKTRKTYIDKERDDESYLGDFGVRKYDYAAGRFTSPDMLWEKYMGWSPYNYCGNNPINASDASGLALMLTGSSNAFDKLNSVVNQGTGNMYGTSVDKNGLTSLVSNGINGVMTEKEQAFYNYLSTVMNPKTPLTSVNLSESSSIEIGDYFASDIDIDDVSALGTSTCITSASALTHELVEQFEKQSKGLPNDWSGFGQAHKEGVKAENAVSGAIRVDVNKRQLNFDGKTGNGTMNFMFNVGNSNATVSITWQSHNVIGVK